ncbi:MAG: copper-binding protein [Phycisphaerales bacterium]|nr:copper-binding protein [Phycisphaerales bacterium]
MHTNSRHHNRRAASRPALLFSIAMLPALVLTACSEQPGRTGVDRPTAEVVFEGEPDAVYTTRGRVQALPTDPDSDKLVILHEPIDEFRDRSGEEVGMNAHAMEFPAIAPGVSLDGVFPGDAVRFAFEVYWPEGGPPLWRVSELEEISPATPMLLDGVARPRWLARLPEVREGATRYITRGQVVTLPDARNDLVIFHEPIPGFRDASGEEVGMEAHAMPFPTIASGVSMEGIEPGVAVEFAFDVSYDSEGAPSYPVVGIRRLIPGVELEIDPSGG